jgi:hypothetical protein
LISRLTRVSDSYYRDEADREQDRAGWLRQIVDLEAREPVVLAGWECAPTVPATSGWWELQSDDSLVEMSRDDLRRRGWDIP